MKQIICAKIASISNLANKYQLFLINTAKKKVRIKRFILHLLPSPIEINSPFFQWI